MYSSSLAAHANARSVVLGRGDRDVHILRLVDGLRMQWSVSILVSCMLHLPPLVRRAYLVRQSQSQLDLVGRDIGVCPPQRLLHRLESSRAGSESAPGNTERVHCGCWMDRASSMALSAVFHHTRAGVELARVQPSRKVPVVSRDINAKLPTTTPRLCSKSHRSFSHATTTSFSNQQT